MEMLALLMTVTKVVQLYNYVIFVSSSLRLAPSYRPTQQALIIGDGAIMRLVIFP